MWTGCYILAMSDLVPHAPRITSTEDGWTIWEYRGARVCSCRVHNRLVMEGHPLHGTWHGHVDAWWPLIDRWLDHGDLPRPYVWPVPPLPVRAR